MAEKAGPRLSTLMPQAAGPRTSLSMAGRRISGAVEAENPRLAHTITKYRDVNTDMDSLESIELMRPGDKFLVWLEDSNLQAKEMLEEATVNLDQFNEEIQIVFNSKKFRPMTIKVAHFREVRRDHECKLSLKLQAKLPADYNDRRLTIVYGRAMMPVLFLHLVAKSDMCYKVWYTGLKGLANAALANLNNADMKYLKSSYLQLLRRAKDEKVTLDYLLERVGAKDKAHKKIAIQFLTESDVGFDKKKKTISTTKFSFLSFLVLHNELELRHDIQEIYLGMLPEGAKFVPLDRIVRFLEEDQGLSAAESGIAVNNILTTLEPHKDARDAKEVSVDGFINYLMSKDGDVYRPQEREKFMDMREPLAHYFIDSSHNSYLTGHQLMGFSSVEMYIQILLMGCRSVEIDLWDGPDDKPLVYHGYTLVTRLKFIDVVNAIDKYAFVSSPYPVILSLENHCSIPQQEYIAATMTSVFKDKLVTYSVDGEKDSNATTWDRISSNLPSPEDLKFKILIKNKKKRKAGEVATVKRQLVISKPVSSMIKEVEAENQPDVELTMEDVDESAPDDVTDMESKEIKALLKKGVDAKAFKARERSTANVAQELSDLVKYTESVPFRSFADSNSNQACTQMSSFVENKALAITRKAPREFMRKNVRQLTRVYPSGLRIESSNYDPMLFWACGCQSVTMNYQTYDAGMQLYRAMFDRNGRTGYVLKPKPMRFASSFRPDATGPVANVKPVTLELTIISGQHLPEANISVSVQVIGVQADRHTVSTKSVKGPHPLWKETFKFEALRLPELVFLRFDVVGAETMLQRIVPFTALRPGYRHVALQTEQNLFVELSSLFIRSKITHIEAEAAKP